MLEATIPTSERLAKALEAEAQTPESQHLIKLIREKEFDEFEGNRATPLVDLVAELRRIGLGEFALRVIDGEFDATNEESEAWFEREGAQLLARSIADSNARREFIYGKPKKHH